MYNLGMVMIGGPGGSARPSFFSGGFSDGFGLDGPNLGQNGQSLYASAKADVAQWDQLVGRLQRVANKTVRDQIATDYGINDPTNQDKGQYTRNGVQTNINSAEGFNPINYLVFEKGDVIHRVARLESYLSDFRKAVEQAETTYGILPEPQVIEKIVTVPGAAGAPAAGGTPSWLVPAAVVGGGVGLAALFGVFGGGK